MSELLTPQTIFAFMFYATYLKRVWFGEPVPEGLMQIVNTILVFYYGYKFGKKSQDNQNGGNHEQKN